LNKFAQILKNKKPHTIVIASFTKMVLFYKWYRKELFPNYNTPWLPTEWKSGKIQQSSSYSLYLNRIFLLCILFFIAACSSRKSVDKGGYSSPLGTSAMQDIKVKVDNYFVEAATQALLLNYPEAISLYKEVLNLQPNNHAALYEVSRLMVQAGRPAEGLDYAQKAWLLQNKNYWYGKQAADVNLMLSKTAEAEKILVKMAELFPDDPEVRIELSDIYLKTGQNDKAIKSLDQLERISGASPQIGLQRFRIYAGTGKPIEAKNEIRKLIRAEPENSDYYRFLHDFFLLQNQPDSAGLVLQNLLEVDPSNSFALISLSQFYKSKGKTKEAAELQSRALKSDGMTPDGRLQLLLALTTQLERDSSLLPQIAEAADGLLKEIPENALLMALRADLFRFRGQYDSARYWLSASLLKEGTQESLWENLLYLDASMERYDLLYKDSERALEYFPNNESILYMQGVSAFSLKKYEDARYALEKTIKVMQEDPQKKAQILGTLGDIYHYLENHELSDKSFEEALKVDQNNATLLNNYAYYLSLRNVQLEKAAEMVMKAMELIPNTASFEDTYGWILYQQGKYSEAKKWIQAAFDKSESADVAHHLGDVYFKTGDAAKAMEYWKKAKKLGIDTPELNSKISSGKF
jgi:tetratricopeptide (TPR) repeat protein